MSKMSAAPAAVAEAAEASELARGVRIDARVAELVEALPLFGVGENFVRFGRFLELGLGVLVARILVGVVFVRELSVRPLDVVLLRVARDSEHLVVVAFVGHGESRSKTDTPGSLRPRRSANPRFRKSSPRPGRLRPSRT
jgi:hypothetical protein